jgi:hypothetical protein
MLMKKNTKLKLLSIFFFILCFFNIYLIITLLNYIYFVAEAAPQWVKFLSLLAMMIPTGYAYSFFMDCFVGGRGKQR